MYITDIQPWKYNIIIVLIILLFLTICVLIVRTMCDRF